MNRSIRFLIVVVFLLMIAGGVLVVLLNDLEQTANSTGDQAVVLMNPRHRRGAGWLCE